MNFKIILHLLRTDWARLKRPLACLWFLLLVSVLPWLVHRPEDWRIPQRLTGGWNNRLGEFPKELLAPWTTSVILPVEMLASLLAVVLASVLGMQWVKQPVTPIRRRERLPALALSLLIFFVLPQWFLSFGNLLLHGFTPGTAALAAGAPALTLWLLLGLAASLAMWLPSIWILLAGYAALVCSVGFLSEIFPQVNRVVSGVPLMPLLPAGPREWLFGALAIALLVLLAPICRRRLRTPWNIAAAVCLILVAGVPSLRLPDPEAPVVTAEASIPTAAIRPTSRYVWFETGIRSSPGKGDQLDVHAALDTTGCPPGYAVLWKAAGGGWISQDGKRIATRCKDDGSAYRDPGSAAGYLNPPNYIPAIEAAASAALSPDPSVSTPGDSSKGYLTTIGTFEIPPSAALLPGRDAELHAELTGTVFRYEKVWDIPLEDAPVKIRTGNLTWHARRHPSSNEEPFADIMVTHPAKGVSSSPDEVVWDASPIFYNRFYFHLPATGAYLRADDQLMGMSGPLYSGAGWHRSILGRPNNGSRSGDITGMRLILLKPVAVARLRTTLVTRFRPWETGDPSDFALLHPYPASESIYRKDEFARRPDPQTCTREEFARWLRVPALIFDTPAAGAARDLACFAPRFADLISKVAGNESAAEGLRLGTPESMRSEVIGKISSLQRPDRLAGVALARGWHREAEEPILRRFNDGGLWDSSVVLSLEEPSTYPELISRFLARPERDTYEKLRMLPGIESMLDDAIARAVRETSGSAPKTRHNQIRNSAPYGPFLYAAKRGDPAALRTVLDIFRAIGPDGDFVPLRDIGYLIDTPDWLRGSKKLTPWLRDQSAASFRFDPLLRIWQPIP